jgi:hypothetical protein
MSKGRDRMGCHDTAENLLHQYAERGCYTTPQNWIPEGRGAGKGHRDSFSRCSTLPLVLLFITVISSNNWGSKMNGYDLNNRSSIPGWSGNILPRFRVVHDYRRGMDGWMDLLTTYTHDWELQVITALSLIYKLYKEPHAKSSPACSVFNNRFLVTDVHSGDSSDSRARVLPSRFQYRTDCQLSSAFGCPNSLLYNSSTRTAKATPRSPVACVTVA